MSAITMTPSQVENLLKDVRDQKSVVITDDGTWYEENWIRRIIRWLTGSENQRLLTIVNVVNNTLDKLEQTSVEFYSDKRKVEDYKKDAKFQAYLELYQELKKQVKAYEKKSTDLRTARLLMDRKIVGLMYRIEKKNGGLNPEKQDNEARFQKLVDMAEKWKERQKLVKHKGERLEQHKKLRHQEEAQLKAAAQYSELLKLLDKKITYQDEFFDWALNSYNPVEVFIQFHATQKTIVDAKAADYLGRNRDSHFAIRKEEILAITKEDVGDGCRKKVLTMPLHHGGCNDGGYRKLKPAIEKVNILDPGQVITFKKGNYSMTLAEFWEQSSQRDSYPVNINMTAFGWENNKPGYGYWDADRGEYVKEQLDFSKDDWEQDLAPTRLIPKKNVPKKYLRASESGDIKANEMFMRVTASRSYTSRYPLECHAGRQYLVPLEDYYKIVDMSPYMAFYPRGIQKALAPGGTGLGTYAFLEQNPNTRQFAHYPVSLGHKAVKDQLLEDLKKILYFQLGGDNCASDTEKGLKQIDSTIPSLFSMDLLDVRMEIKLFDDYMRFLKQNPYFMQYYGAGGLICLVLGFRNHQKEDGTYASLLKRYLQGYEKGLADFFNPALLHEQILDGKLEGDVCWGNVDLQNM